MRALAALGALFLGGCTFGTLPTSRCIEYYGQGVVDAAAQARAAGSITREAYAYCADGKARIDAAIPPLRAHGFRTSEPGRHFEVPGGWCVGAERAVSGAEFDAMRSLETICAIGDASKAYFTGGSLTSTDGRSHAILSTFDRKARDELEARLKKNAQ